MDVKARLNEVADHLAHEGLTYRASRVREGAVEIARQCHRTERLKAALKAVLQVAEGKFQGEDWQAIDIARAALAGKEET